MIKQSLMGFILLAVSALSADNIALPINLPADGEGESGVYMVRLTFGAPQSVAEVAVKPRTYYQLSWEAKIVAGGPLLADCAVKTGDNTLVTKWPAGDDWSKTRVYFYNDSAAVAEIAFAADAAGQGKLRSMTLEAMTPAMLTHNLIFAAGFEDGKLFADWWKKTYAAETDFINDPVNDWLDGNCGVEVLTLPAAPGKGYTVSFWAKSDRDVNVTALVNLLPPGNVHAGKHFFVRKPLHLSSEWRHREIEFMLPKDTAEYPDLQSHLVQVLLIAKDWQTGQIRFEHIQFRRW